MIGQADDQRRPLDDVRPTPPTPKTAIDSPIRSCASLVDHAEAGGDRAAQQRGDLEVDVVGGSA